MTAPPHELWMALALAAALMGLVGQWHLLRRLHARRVTALRSRHLQLQIDLSGKLADARRQVGLLQQELAVTRVELRQRRERGVKESGDARPTREALERVLDRAAAVAPRLPASGFADTLPSTSQGGAVAVRQAA